MPIETTSLADVDADLVRQELAEASQRVQEDAPALDVRRGVVHDLLTYYHAVFSARHRQDLNRYLSARSLLDIEADPTLADPGVVDAVLSNFRLTRGDGASARGEVVIALNAALSVTIASGAAFESGGRRYTSDAAFTSKAEPEQINGSDDRLLTLLSDGSWAFTINVTAEEAGTAGLVRKDALVVPIAPPLGYITSYAASDFVGGLDGESNADLLARLQQGIAAKAPSNRVNMQAMLREVPAFSRVVTSSIIGHGDEEMIRDQHTIWPGSLGGRADWYIRTDERAAALTLNKSAAYISTDETGAATWRIGIGRDEAPGFFEVESIRRSGSTAAGTLTLTDDVRGLDLTTDGEFVPDVLTVAEGAYSRFQTAVVDFLDDPPTIAEAGVRDYDVAVRYLPLVGEIQDYISGFDVRSYGADVLIKSPVPCFIALTMTVHKSRKQDAPDVAAITDALCREVNRTGFSGRLYAGRLHDVVHGYLSEGMSVAAVDMFGRIRAPDGTISYVRSGDVLEIPADAASSTMVSSRTVQFFTSPEAVTIEVSTDIPVPQ